MVFDFWVGDGAGSPQVIGNHDTAAGSRPEKEVAVPAATNEPAFMPGPCPNMVTPMVPTPIQGEDLRSLGLTNTKGVDL